MEIYKYTDVQSGDVEYSADPDKYREDGFFDRMNKQSIKVLDAEDFEQPAPVQGWKMVPVEPTREIEDAIAKARTLKASEIWGDAIAAAPQPQQEPVAWMHEWEDGERIPTLHPRDARESDKPTSVRPLVYGDTSPSAHRKPLTDDERIAIVLRWKRGNWTAADIIDAVEAAHNIKEQQVCQNSELAPNRKPAKQDGALTNEGAKAPAKCWKCGDSDPAFTDVCQVPACGMREGT